MRIVTATAGIINYWSADDTYRMIHEAGFDGVDWNLPILSGWDRSIIAKGRYTPSIFDGSVDEMLQFYKPQIDAAQKYGVRFCQAHSPFPPYVKNFSGFTDYCIGINKKLIKFCDILEIKNLIIHGISLAVDDETQTVDSIRELNNHLYESLIPTVKDTNVMICLENLFTSYRDNRMQAICSDPHEANEYIDRFNVMAGKECFGFCYDTGHNNLLGGNQREFICTIGKRLKALHIHDNNGDFDAHLAPYAGNVIWKSFIDGLKQVDYHGDLSFETVKQIDIADGVDREVVPVLLRSIHDIGKTFEKMLEA